MAIPHRARIGDELVGDAAGGVSQYITRARLTELLDRFQSVRVAVIGDFFLDRYLVTDRALAEVSVETGQRARQVVAQRASPGHAGTVVSNLLGLKVEKVCALGAIGDDGEGYELRRLLESDG